MEIEFDNSYARLPERFYTRLNPEPVPSPRVIRVNEDLAQQLGFDPEWLASEEGAAFAVGNRILDEADPLATVYAGHQFGNWVPRLGDGRAILLGEVLDREGERFDIQLKGSGRTPYSRRGDGRSPLGPVLREYIISEAMEALGIPTTRALAAATTGAQVRRETLLPGGVLVRVARSHVRVGTFEYFSGQRDHEAIRTLMAHVVDRHYPDVDPDSPVALLRAVAQRQATLVAQWMLVGFIHGVMNTDNMLMSGETIDYGPCAFMNEYDPGTVYSSIDRLGRYAYGNQPAIAQWNLARLAEALLAAWPEPSLLDEAKTVIENFPDLFRATYGEGMGRKLGLGKFEEADWPLVEDLLELMYETGSDYTLTFRRLTELADPDTDPKESVSRFFELPTAFEPWLARWRTRLRQEKSSAEERARALRQENPVIIPRNHNVERAIADGVDRANFESFQLLVDTLGRPFDFPAHHAELARPPRAAERVSATFCGT